MPIGSKRMSAIWLGKGKTRPIPRDVWSDDAREQSRNAIQTRTRTAPQFGKGPSVNAPQVAGRRVRGSVGGSGFNPAQSNAKQR